MKKYRQAGGGGNLSRQEAFLAVGACESEGVKYRPETQSHRRESSKCGEEKEEENLVKVTRHQQGLKASIPNLNFTAMLPVASMLIPKVLK